MEEHSDVHEFVPWSHFGAAKSRPMGVVAGVVVVVVGVGAWILLGQGPAVAPQPITAVVPEVSPIEVEPVLLSERDLLALDTTTARMVAEEFVVSYFTRSGAAPSYVEWARAGVVEHQENVVVSVRYSLLSGDPMTRRPVREAAVQVELSDGVWRVLGLPVDREAPEIEHVTQGSGVVNELGFEVGAP